MRGPEHGTPRRSTSVSRQSTLPFSPIRLWRVTAIRFSSMRNCSLWQGATSKNGGKAPCSRLRPGAAAVAVALQVSPATACGRDRPVSRRRTPGKASGRRSPPSWREPLAVPGWLFRLSRLRRCPELFCRRPIRQRGRAGSQAVRKTAPGGSVGNAGRCGSAVSAHRRFGRADDGCAAGRLRRRTAIRPRAKPASVEGARVGAGVPACPRGGDAGAGRQRALSAMAGRQTVSCAGSIVPAGSRGAGSCAGYCWTLKRVSFMPRRRIVSGTSRLSRDNQKGMKGKPIIGLFRWRPLRM